MSPYILYFFLSILVTEGFTLFGAFNIFKLRVGIIRDNFFFMVSQINLRTHKESVCMQERIYREQTRKDQARRLLDILPTKGPQVGEDIYIYIYMYIERQRDDREQVKERWIDKEAVLKDISSSNFLLLVMYHLGNKNFPEVLMLQES